MNANEIVSQLSTSAIVELMGCDSVDGMRKCAEEKGLFPDHAYTVLAIDERGNVLLRNPWGDHPYTGPEPAGYQIEGEGPGTFAVSSQTFARNFPDVCWEKMKATA